MREKEGMFFEMGSFYPRALHTRWGKIGLYGGGMSNGRDNAFEPMLRDFFRRLEMSFHTIVSKSESIIDRATYYFSDKAAWLAGREHGMAEDIILLDYDTLVPIIATYRGNKDIVLYRNYNGSGAAVCNAVYKIHAVDDVGCEDATYQKASEKRSYNATKMIWAFLRNMHAVKRMLS